MTDLYYYKTHHLIQLKMLKKRLKESLRYVELYIKSIKKTQKKEKN